MSEPGKEEKPRPKCAAQAEEADGSPRQCRNLAQIDGELCWRHAKMAAAGYYIIRWK